MYISSRDDLTTSVSADKRRKTPLHMERLFMVTDPIDKFFYNIQRVIKYLARMKFNKSQLQEKARDSR